MPRKPSSSWLRESLGHLGKLIALTANWDSYGAWPIRPGVIVAATELLVGLSEKSRHLGPVPHIAPLPGASPGSTLQIEWDMGGRSLEIEFLNKETLVFLTVDNSRDEKMESDEYPASDLKKTVKLLDWLTALKFCPACEDYRETKIVGRDETYTVQDREVTVAVQIAVCVSCGEQIGSDEADQKILDAATESRRLALGAGSSHHDGRTGQGPHVGRVE